MTDYTKDAHALPYPEGGNKVAVHSDIQALAVKAGIALTQEGARVEEAAKAMADDAYDRAKWKRGAVEPNVSIREHYYGADKVGQWACLSGTVCATLTDLPAELAEKPTGFTLTVQTMGDGVILTINTYDVWGDAEYTCNSAPAGTIGWTSWKKTAYISDLPKGDGGGTVRPGFKGAAAPLGAPSGAYDTEAAAAGRCRIPTLYTFNCTRIRIHGANHNWRSNTFYSGQVNITGFWWGQGNTTTGTYSTTPTKIVDAFTTPADGSEWVTPWVNIPDLRGVGNLLSFGWANALGQENVQSRSGGWRDTSPGSASALTGGAATKTMPFHVWIEFEVSQDTPVGAELGSSGAAGQGSTIPMFQTGLMEYCRRIGAVPTIYAQPGTAMAQWTDPAHEKWKQWAPYARPDFMIVSIGQNNMYGSATLAEVKAEITQIVQNIRDKVTDNIFMTTVPPRDDPAADETLRRQYNAWLKTRPLGVRDVFDVSAALSADDDTIRPEFNADGVHANELGGKAKADAINRPVIPPRLLITEDPADPGFFLIGV